MSALYEARNLTRIYDGRTALSLPSFRMERGEVLALTGCNGSGKSTLLRLLAFLERPDSGTLEYRGPGGDPRRHVTLLLQEPYLLKESVFRNVTLGLRLRGETAGLEDAYARAMAAVGFERPGDLARRESRALSGGERQRVALAARLILKPDVLLMDEPTSNVDARSARIIVDAVNRGREEGLNVAYATHDPILLRALGGRELRLGEDWSVGLRRAEDQG